MIIITGRFLRQQLHDVENVLLFAYISDPSGTRKERYYTALWDRIRRGQVLLSYHLPVAAITAS